MFPRRRGTLRLAKLNPIAERLSKERSNIYVKLLNIRQKTARL